MLVIHGHCGVSFERPHSALRSRFGALAEIDPRLFTEAVNTERSKLRQRRDDDDNDRSAHISYLRGRNVCSITGTSFTTSCGAATGDCGGG